MDRGERRLAYEGFCPDGSVGKSGILTAARAVHPVGPEFYIRRDRA